MDTRTSADAGRPAGLDAGRRSVLKPSGVRSAALTATSALNPAPAEAQAMFDDADNFYASARATLQKVSVRSQYGMSVAGNLVTPSDLGQAATRPAIVVGHPMGAVKEQSANLHATKMAEQGFVTMAIDLPFRGGGEGQPRNAAPPDLYAEAVSAAIDFLGTQPFVDRERIGAIGVCGSGSFVIGAAKIDPRMRAVATVSMYDMGSAARNALNHSQSVEQRKAAIAAAAEQRWVELTGGATQHTSGAPHELTGNAIGDELYDFYRTPRGEVTSAGTTPELTTHATLSSSVKFMNVYPFNDIETISPRPMLFTAGDQAHSREFSEDAYARAAEPKELHVVPGAGHVDLCDHVGLIPFDKLGAFFGRHLA